MRFLQQIFKSRDITTPRLRLELVEHSPAVSCLLENHQFSHRHPTKQLELAAYLSKASENAVQRNSKRHHVSYVFNNCGKWC